MRAGSLSKYVSIVNPIKIGKDAYGSDIFDYQVIANVYAEIQSRATNETQVFNTSTSKQNSQIRIRYTPLVNRTMQIWWNDKKYSINSIVNTDEKNKEMILDVSEVV